MAKVETKTLSINKLPSSSYHYIKEKDDSYQIKSIFQDLLQVTINNYAVIYNIEDLNAIHEVQYLENINQFTDNPDYLV